MLSRSSVLGALCAVGALLVPSAAAAASPPVPAPIFNHLTAFAASLSDPEALPPGANRPCTPSAAHPRPVVLIHGTWENARQNWSAMAPLLAREGYCVFTYDYGAPEGVPFKGDDPIEANAARLANEVERVLAATGAAEVDLVGHSAGGGVTPRYYLGHLGGAARVHTLVGIAPSNHGTTLSGLGTAVASLPFAVPVVDAVSPAALQQLPGSAFNVTLDAGGDTVPGVSYRVVATRYDEVITPWTNSFLEGPDVQNVEIQRLCPQDRSEHLALPYDRNALRVVLNWLDPDHTRPVTCVPTLPLVGG